jgi:hypothetical protein
MPVFYFPVHMLENLPFQANCASVLGKQGNGAFPERRMSTMEQDSGRGDIRSERNMPFPCLRGVSWQPVDGEAADLLRRESFGYT